ncbi:MAG: hypothetical protein HYX60_05815, partial [Legionella longbeachae]|nr:hypothetical protein [Legionella longbeachae]
MAKKITPSTALANYRNYAISKYTGAKNFDETLKNLNWLENDKEQYKTLILSKGNNTNIIITPIKDQPSKFNSVVITFTEIYYSAYTFINKLPTEYFPKKYKSLFPQDIETCQKTYEFRNEIYNAYDKTANKEKSYILIEEVLEYAPKTLAYIGLFTNKLYNIEKELSEETIINMTRQISSIVNQLSNLLMEVENNNGVWTDFKLSNVLLRINDTIMIADRKAFFPINSLPRNTNPNELRFPDLSLAYLSAAFEDRLQRPIKMEDALSIWKNEYSYILGGIIYHMITGIEVLRENWSPTDPKLNFDHP